MSQIEITCIDQTAIYTDTPEIFSGDVNVDTVKFIFDDSWTDYTNKTAVFYNDPKNVYSQILDVNDVAVIPSQVIVNKCKLSIGVVGTNANGDIKTSKILTYSIGKGAISDDLESSAATPDIWLQILTQIEELRTFLDERQDDFENQITQKQDDFETQITQKQDSMQAQLDNALANRVYVYALNDTVSDDYVSALTLPYNFVYGGAVVLNNEIHLLGGFDGNFTKHYKWNGTSWTSVSTLPYNFASGNAVVLNNEIHILGGAGDRTKHYKWNGTSWTSVSTLPYYFRDGSAVVLNNEIHLLGSDVDSSTYTKHYKWDGTSWTSVSTLPYKFYYGSAVVLNDEIHLLGSDSTGNRTSHYKWDGTTWTSVSTLPYDFYLGSAVVLNDEIHLLGGDGNFTKHYKLVSSNYLSGYVKANVNIYLPISTEARTSNLEAIDGGYRVTEDGYVKILIK